MSRWTISSSASDGPSREPEVAAAVTLVHHRTGREPFDLTVLRHGDAEAEGVLEGPPHEQWILHAVAVVGEQLDAGSRQFGERGQLLPGPADGDRRRRMNVAQPGSLALAADELDDADTVLCRVGVRHRDHCGVPAERGRARPGLDRLGFLLAGLAEMRVEVDEARRHGEAGRVEDAIVIVRARSVPTSAISPSTTRRSARRAPCWSTMVPPVIERFMRAPVVRGRTWGPGWPRGSRTAPPCGRRCRS